MLRQGLMQKAPRIPELRRCSFMRHYQSRGGRHTAWGRRDARRRGPPGRKERRAAERRRKVQNDDRTNISKSCDSKESIVSEAAPLRNKDWMRWFWLTRYRSTGSFYTREQLVTLLQRMPLWLAIATFFVWEETSPYSILTLHGPSMIPTMKPDGSEVWLRSTWTWWRRLGWKVSYKKGDLVGFAHPDHPSHVSCKRIVGGAGDTVQRYGQYVHLYVAQDPKNWGINLPDADDQLHSWIDRQCPWDEKNYCLRDAKEECKRTIVVPEGCVWVEGDCPAISVDSRQCGPIPVEWLCGKIVARLWPLWEKQTIQNPSWLTCRPHPVPLDEQSLCRYNLHVTPNRP